MRAQTAPATPVAPEDLGIGRLFEQFREAAIVAEVASGRVVLWNPAAERLFGYSADQAVGQLVEDLIVPERLRGAHRAGLARFRETGRGALVDGQRLAEFPARTRTGAELTVELSLVPLEGPTGPFVLALIRDATGRSPADLALQREREFTRGLIDSSTDGILSFDLECRYTTWNPAMERMTGLPRAVVLGHPAFEVFPFLRETGEDRFYAEALAGRTVVASDRPYRVPETGRAGFFEAHYAPIRDELGTLIGGLAIIRDITERKRAEAERAELAREQAARAEAEAALRERDQVLATVSHDLKAPLTTIRGQAQWLRRQAHRSGAFELDRTLKGLELIDTAAAKMVAWIDELLDTARLEAGRPLELQRQPTDLVALAWQVAAEHQRTTERHRIRVQTREARLIGVWDAARLGRVLDNLVANAVKYSPTGGQISIEVEHEPGAAGDWAVLCVRDQGIGIPEADQPHIFERFRRGGNVVGRIAGTGIGLAGARQIVEQHDGTLSVESREGAGSTFILRLPL